MHAATTGWWLLGGVGLLLVARFGPALLEWRRARRRIDEIAAVAHPAEDGEWQVVDSGSPFAFTVGLVDPVVYLSSGLLEQLDATSRRVVLAHEFHHARRRHAVVKLAAWLGTVFVAPGTRSWLLSELGLALEQSSDSHAAEAVADPIPVAETILAVERLAGENRAERAGPVGLASFGGGDIERRVRGLVDDPAWRPAGWGFWMVCAMAFVAAATHYEALHHGAETLFELL
jgi:Zn-dependent protease with chaperone function